MTTMNFANAKTQNSFEVMPAKTLVKLRLGIKAGFYNDPSKGWTNGWATLGQTGAIYLKTECDVIEGEYKGRKIFGLIGLYSPKYEIFAELGSSFIRAVLESAKNIDPKDCSPEANAKRSIKSFDDLVGLTFIGEVKVGETQNGEPKNEIKKVVTNDHPRYRELMGLPKLTVGAYVEDDEIPFLA